MDVVEQVRAAGAREWSDELEAVSAILGAAGVWEKATARRRLFARQLVLRKVTGSDVLTWALHGLRLGHGPGWLVRALELDPETIWRARSKGAIEQVAGTVNWIRRQQVADLVAKVGQSAAVADADAGDTIAARAKVAGAASERALRRLA